MSTKKQCFIYTKDSNNGENGWKMIELDKEISKIQTTKTVHSCHKHEPKNTHSSKCHKVNKCCNPNVCTLVSVKNPDTELIIPEEPTTANNATAIVGEAVDLVKWTPIVPDALNSFNNLTGTFVAPEAGDYFLDLVVNFRTSVSIPVDPSLDNVPYIEIYDVDTDAHILASSFPTINIIVPIPPMSTGELPVDVPVAAILGTGQVIISAVVPLLAGQRIRVRAVTNGLIYFPPLNGLQIPPLPPRIDLSPPGVDTTFAIYKFRNSPTVTITCNN